MRIDYTPQLDFKDVLIRPKRTTITSRSLVSLERTFTFPNTSAMWTGVPIISANMDTTGTFEVYDILSEFRMITCFHKHYTLEDFKARLNTKPALNPEFFMVSVGINEDYLNYFAEIVKATNAKWICIDVANGYMNKVVEFTRKVRTMFPNKIIVAGNVASQEMVEELILNGKADVVKEGIGPGSACLTRRKTGVGVPQLSSIIECADGAHGVNGCIIGDGGITCPGDLAKAFGGGADFVMVGGQFSGHDENPGETEIIDGKKYKLFYGMSSEHAMKKHYGKMASYRSSEGRLIKVPYKGSLVNTVKDYLGGLRSTCAYINAHTIKNIPKCTTFLVVGQQLNTHFQS